MCERETRGKLPILTKNRALQLLICSWLVTLPCISGAQIKKTGNGYLFRYKFSPGKTIKYSVASKVMRPNNGPTYIYGPFVETVKGLSNSGAQMTATFGPLKSGQHSIMGAMHYNFSETTLGKIATPNAPQMFPIYPQQSIKVGQSWDATANGAALGSKSTINARYTFLGVMQLKGHDVAKINFELIASGQADTTGVGTDYFLLSDGSLWQSEFRMIMTPPGGSGKMRVEFTMSR